MSTRSHSVRLVELKLKHTSCSAYARKGHETLSVQARSMLVHSGLIAKL